MRAATIRCIPKARFPRCCSNCPWPARRARCGAASDCYATSSQEWLFRIWRRGFDIRTMPHLTVMQFPSGLRAASYLGPMHRSTLSSNRNSRGRWSCGCCCSTGSARRRHGRCGGVLQNRLPWSACARRRISACRPASWSQNSCLVTGAERSSTSCAASAACHRCPSATPPRRSCAIDMPGSGRRRRMARGESYGVATLYASSPRRRGPIPTVASIGTETLRRLCAIINIRGYGSPPSRGRRGFTSQAATPRSPCW